MARFELNPHWKSDLVENLAACVGLALIVIGICFAFVVLTPIVKSIAACPIHITTDRSDYCLRIGVGR